MAAFRKFDPHAFLADEEEGARSKVTADAPETLAALATLAGERPPSGKERSEVNPSTDKSNTNAAKAAKFAKTYDEKAGSLASLATLEAKHSENEIVSSGAALAKVAKPANPSGAGVGADAWGATQEERAGIVEYDGGVPRAWAEGFARLDPDHPPGDVPLQRWQTFVDDCARFLDGGWAKKAAALGWGPLDLFGTDRERPLARIDHAGLLWLLNGARLVALAENTVTMETNTGTRQTYRRKPNEPGRVLAWDLAVD
jgi:hypothetical protein